MPTGVYPRTTEARENMALAKIGKPRPGDPKNWKHNEETKKKLSKFFTKIKPKERPCKECGEVFLDKYDKKFCGQKCFYQNLKKTRTGTNNPSYRNGTYTRANKYNETTSAHNLACKKYRKEFLEKHGYCFCERCKTNNSLRFETHHIVYASEKPKHKELHNPKNLILLCIKCHNELHGEKCLRNGLVQERGLNELFDKNLYLIKKTKSHANSNQASVC